MEAPEEVDRRTGPDAEATSRRLTPPGAWSWPAPLLPYQVDGVNALLARPGLLLADDMGLGKTIQAIAAHARPGPARRRPTLPGRWRPRRYAPSGDGSCAGGRPS